MGSFGKVDQETDLSLTETGRWQVESLKTQLAGSLTVFLCDLLCVGVVFDSLLSVKNVVFYDWILGN